MNGEQIVSLLSKKIEPNAHAAASRVFKELSVNAEYIAHQHPIEHVTHDEWERFGVPLLMQVVFDKLAVELSQAATGWHEVLMNNLRKEPNG